MKILWIPEDWVVDEIRNSWGAAVVGLLTAGMDGAPKAPPEASEAGIGAPPEADPKVLNEAPTEAGASLTRALPKRTWSSISGVTNSVLACSSQKSILKS